MKLTFFGGAGTVTGSKILLETETKKLLIDCGLFQGLKELRLKNWEEFPVEFKNIDEFCRIVEALDYIDENIDSILSKMKDGETKIFIGKENPIKEISNCSMVVSPYTNKNGERGVLAIVGPKRMKYAKNKSLLDYVRSLLGSSMAIFMIIKGASLSMG